MWYKSFGFSRNPFLINPFKEITGVVGREKEFDEALYYIKSGAISFLEGSQGVGKTRIVKSIIDKFPGKIIYVNAEKLKKNVDVEQLLIGKTGISGKLFGKMPKGMILIIENIEDMSSVNFERLKYFYDNDYIQSVIFTGKSYEKVAMPVSLKHRIASRIIQLEPLSTLDAIKVIQDRLEDDENSILESSIIKELYDKSGNNLNQLIEMCNKVCIKMHEAGDDKVTGEHMKDLEEINKKKSIEIVDSMIDNDGTELIKVGEYYRNPSVDVFCEICGAIVSLQEVTCPECGAEFEEEISNKQETNEENSNDLVVEDLLETTEEVVENEITKKAAKNETIEEVVEESTTKETAGEKAIEEETAEKVISKASKKDNNKDVVLKPKKTDTEKKASKKGDSNE